MQLFISLNSNATMYDYYYSYTGAGKQNEENKTVSSTSGRTLIAFGSRVRAEIMQTTCPHISHIIMYILCYLTVKTTKRWTPQATRKNDSQTRRVAASSNNATWRLQFKFNRRRQKRFTSHFMTSRVPNSNNYCCLYINNFEEYNFIKSI